MQAQERIMAKSFSDRFVFYARESKMNGKEKRKTGERSRIEDLRLLFTVGQNLSSGKLKKLFFV